MHSRAFRPLSLKAVRRQTGQTFRRDREGKLYDSGDSFFRTAGLNIYFDLINSFTAALYSEQIDLMLALDELDEASRSFLADHRDTALLYSVILSSGRAEFADGTYPLSDTLFDGAEFMAVFNTTEGSHLGSRQRIPISEKIPMTSDASRGITLKAVPISDIPQILGYETEYYIRDIYSNEIVLPVNESTPVLRNIANAEITPDGLRYGKDLLSENTDYERYELSDGGTVFFGTGHYAGILRAGD